MKKILATFLLLLTLTAPLFGCDNSDISEASDPKNASDSISDTSNGGIAADFEYSVIRDGTISIDKYIGNAAEVVIPDTIDGIPVTLILKEIHESAFMYCESLYFIELPSSLEYLSTDVFDGCKSLKSLRIPQNCLRDLMLLVLGNSGIETIELSEGITSIPDKGFWAMHTLKKLILPTTLKEIGESAIFVCPNLEEIILPEGLEIIRPMQLRSTTS